MLTTKDNKTVPFYFLRTVTIIYFTLIALSKNVASGSTEVAIRNICLPQRLVSDSTVMKNGRRNTRTTTLDNEFHKSHYEFTTTQTARIIERKRKMKQTTQKPSNKDRLKADKQKQQ